jgi:alpha-tubulin suppressor-like RCC1 family protein
MWGATNDGRLGINVIGVGNRSNPVTTFAGGNDWKSVACSNGSTFAIKTDGSLWVWGFNNNGQLGTNDLTARGTPVTTFAGGNNWKQSFSCAATTIAAIKTDGTLWVWGGNSVAQLGTNDKNNRSTPVTTFAGGTNWKQVALGNQHTAAIKTDGTLWTWGRNNESGQGGNLGTNDTTERVTPVPTFAGGTNWKQVSCGSLFTAAVKTDGTLWTWGSGTDGKLGINAASTNRTTPVTTFAGGNNWKQVSCIDFHISAIKTDGSLWVWGANGSGQLGTNDAITRSTPVTTFAGGNNWKQVSAGGAFTTAIQSNDYI